MKIFVKPLAGFSLITIALALSYICTPVLADPLTSPHYQFQETSLGGTGLYGSSSANYQSQQAGSILGLGTSTSADFQLNAGNITTNDPALAFSVDTPDLSFSGPFSPTNAVTAFATFEVADYTSYGYSVQIFGTSPTHGSHIITALSSATSSMAGVEQFGINVVANTSPVSLGANPNHGQFGFGSAATNYNTPNNYRFVSGDIIAQAPKSSGITIYTISYIVNVASVTPAGQYVSSQTLICTGTY
ncbi:MAG: hypothetical protein ACREGG_02065 [Candidatus Saccharimonadales bacterium]